MIPLHLEHDAELVGESYKQFCQLVGEFEGRLITPEVYCSPFDGTIELKGDDDWTDEEWKFLERAVEHYNKSLSNEA
jgi:hypothetical protein